MYSDFVYLTVLTLFKANSFGLIQFRWPYRVGNSAPADVISSPKTFWDVLNGKLGFNM